MKKKIKKNKSLLFCEVGVFKFWFPTKVGYYIPFFAFLAKKIR